MIVRTNDDHPNTQRTHHEITKEKPFRKIRFGRSRVHRWNTYAPEAKAIDVQPNAGVTQVATDDQRVAEEQREARVSAMWDMFIATIMTVLFASLRVALFCFFWVLLLMAVPTILSVL